MMYPLTYMIKQNWMVAKILLVISSLFLSPFSVFAYVGYVTDQRGQTLYQIDTDTNTLTGSITGVIFWGSLFYFDISSWEKCLLNRSICAQGL